MACYRAGNQTIAIKLINHIKYKTLQLNRTMLNLCQECSVVITCIYANCFLSTRAHVRSHVTDVYDCVNPVWEVTTPLYPVLITSRSFVLNGQLGWTRWTGWTQIIIHKEQVRDVQKNNKVLQKNIHLLF